MNDRLSYDHLYDFMMRDSRLSEMFNPMVGGRQPFSFRANDPIAAYYGYNPLNRLFGDMNPNQRVGAAWNDAAGLLDGMLDNRAGGLLGR